MYMLLGPVLSLLSLALPTVARHWTEKLIVTLENLSTSVSFCHKRLMSMNRVEDNIHRYSETVNILYNSNIFVFAEPSPLQSLQSLIPPKRWNIIRSLEVHGISIDTWPEFGYYWHHFPEEEDEWVGRYKVIKTLKGLRHFTLVSHCTDDLRNMATRLEPLKDLGLENPWELKIRGSPDDVKAVDANLKRAGFDCSVISWPGSAMMS